MRTRLFLVCAAAALTLQACDRPKASSSTTAETAAPATPAATAEGALPAIVSKDLPKRPEFPGFYLDTIGLAKDPLTKPAVVTGGANLEMTGFGFDPVTKTPAKGVELEVDGELFATFYGHGRQDVADNLKVPALVPVGYRTTLPKTLAPGEHTVVVRVISADGTAYYGSNVVKFTVK